MSLKLIVVQFSSLLETNINESLQTNMEWKLKRFLMLIRYFESEKIAAGSPDWLGWAH